MGAVPFQEAKCALFGEPGDVADLDQEPRSTGRADARQVEQSGAGGGDASTGLAGGVAGPHLRKENLGLCGRDVLLRATGDELEEQLVELGDHPGVVLTQGAWSVDED